MDYESYYDRLSAVHSIDFNKCFYCGCEASEFDYSPPIAYIHEWKDGSRSADFIAVPCCYECYGLLKKHNSGTLDSRVSTLKLLLQSKYEKAINIYNLWQKKELRDMDTSFQKSIDAGIKLGTESIERLRFKGFDYEVNGSITRVSDVGQETITVFGEEFTDYKEALEYASNSYRINKAQLSELYFENGKSFDKAIAAFHRTVEAKKSESELAKPCREFAKKHSQNSKFVIRTVKRYLEQDPELTISLALEKLYNEHISSL